VTAPSFGPVGRNLRRAVHRFHGGVGEERGRVDRLDLFGRASDRLDGIAVLAAAIIGRRVEAVAQMRRDGSPGL
jgi:hypothetical protein